MKLAESKLDVHLKQIHFFCLKPWPAGQPSVDVWMNECWCFIDSRWNLYSAFCTMSLCFLLVHVQTSFSPANCLSDVPLPPNFVTSFPLDWKMKTQQALLSTVMMWPFLSTATPLGPMRRPAPILFWGRGGQNTRETLVLKVDVSVFHVRH